MMVPHGSPPSLCPRTLNGHGRNVCQAVAQQPHDRLGAVGDVGDGRSGWDVENTGKPIGYSRKHEEFITILNTVMEESETLTLETWRTIYHGIWSHQS